MFKSAKRYIKYKSKHVYKSVKRFIDVEEGFDLAQFAAYTALAIGALAFVWFTFLKPRIETAGESVGDVIERGYEDIPD